VRHDDARVDNVEHAVRDTIREEFGKDSPEFQRHAHFKIDDGPVMAPGIAATQHLKLLSYLADRLL
jgi:hypothetical protein